MEIAIYSSGSIFAQKLLFAHVKDPASDDRRATLDLSHLIADWYDTTNAGPKMEASSYVKIAKELHKPADAILFLSDNVNEVKAALEAGMQSAVVDRPGNAVLSDEDRRAYTIVNSLDAIELVESEGSPRKRKVEASTESSMKKTKEDDMGTAPSTRDQGSDQWCMSHYEH